MNPKIRPAILFAFCAFPLLLLSAGSCERTPPEYREFLHLSPTERREKLRLMPIDKQIDYYLAGTSYVHPPLLELGDVIANQGKDAVPPLTKRLREEKSEHAQLMLMYVFNWMNRHNYNLKQEGEALRALKEVTANMKENKPNAERVLEEILQNQPPDLEKLKRSYPESFPSENRKKP
jgi:hypothetical protein